MSARKLPDNKTLVKLYKIDGLNSAEIARLYGCTRESACRGLKNAGVKMRRPVGDNHGMWKGGRTTKGDGYVGVWTPGHERADNQNRVYEHTLVIEKHIGRLPNKGEVIHHINGNKKDNRMENLYLCNHKNHKNAHWSIDRLVGELLTRDIVEFIDGEYQIKENQAGNSVTVPVIHDIARRLQ